MGVSESAYNAQDLEFTYNTPTSAFQSRPEARLADDAVVAPYATALASMVDPQAAVRNFERLEALGAAAVTVSTRRWTSRETAFRTEIALPLCVLSWPTTKA